jgi:hypothetical protein
MDWIVWCIVILFLLYVFLDRDEQLRAKHDNFVFTLKSSRTGPRYLEVLCGLLHIPRSHAYVGKVVSHNVNHHEKKKEKRGEQGHLYYD